MDNNALRDYLYRHIPLTRAMQVEVQEATTARVRLAAPLEPNINHRETVFGGSASAVAILSAWALLYMRLQELGLNSRVVIHASNMRFDRPIAGTFTATAESPDTAAWQRFLTALQRHHRARVTLDSVLEFAGEKAGEMRGEFVALDP